MHNYLPDSSQRLKKIPKSIYSTNKGRGYSKISAILFLTALIIATALTFLLVQSTSI